ncbi:hypothetical protein E3V39_03550 [Gammaproteobacteria bacterium LSUCC0112]|nr:hypothetical protein E3V39_03550 [Gammaproteobacteria bacterium LSUCC0112]
MIAKLCYKGADELGRKFAEETGAWRQRNAGAILEQANQKYERLGFNGDEQASPRLVHHILDEGSWSESSIVQDLWSGLLASSCTLEGNDDSNLIFINLLRDITSTQAKIINYSCENAFKMVTAAGWIQANHLSVELDEIVNLSGVEDIQRLDRELDHLRSLGLLHGGFSPYHTSADLTPTPLGLQMYVRCKGYIGSPVEYFGLLRADANLPNN